MLFQKVIHLIRHYFDFVILRVELIDSTLIFFSIKDSCSSIKNRFFNFVSFFNVSSFDNIFDWPFVSNMSSILSLPSFSFTFFSIYFLVLSFTTLPIFYLFLLGLAFLYFEKKKFLIQRLHVLWFLETAPRLSISHYFQT